ncbi:hypothetical protein B0T17DRAFT_616725 [Bombardia bombarda]|uniref:Uncharacterized protein n=1 Tax=Bombardia bombarda TaxID=252184 RepID=A0AA39XD22_9PEZI|nr:hypothetical protein B0T17DRAFT_616725 [Bombardia bombarda]
MEESNGNPKGAKFVNGINGNIKPTINGHAVGPRRIKTASGPGLVARSFNIAARLLTWYSILSILFRCPASLDACDESSPQICKPYFQLKQTVTPHLEPYYDTYAAPYVDLVRPYYNTVDQAVIAPSWGYAKKIGAPRIHQAQVYSQAQWEKTVQPQIVKYQQLAKTQYDQSLGPHVSQLSTAVGPYYEIARTNALQTYHELLLPSYEYVQPYATRSYQVASVFTAGTVVPSAIWAWNKTYVFLDGTVWPQLRVIYVENVEPQLVKIGQRLGRHNSGKKTVPKSPTDASASSLAKIASSFTKPTVSASTSVASTTSLTKPSASVTRENIQAQEKEHVAPESGRTRSTAEQVSPPEVDEALESEDPHRRTARETVAADLKDWQERYAKAADEGASEIDQRVQEISKRMIRRNAKVTGKSLLEQLQSSVVSEMVTLRRDILQAVNAVSKEDIALEKGKEQVVAAVRRAGMAVKEKAQDVRNWRESYEAEMQMAITKAAETHFAILENIRDLALQKIGMKWAWMDGVTYKDWAKYHLLKSRFEEWKDDLENLIVTHPSLEAAQIEGANVEDEAMEIAASAAKELARLKQVASWKLVAGDDTPEFDSTLMQQAAEAAESAKLAAANIINSVEESAGDVKEAVVEKVEEGVSVATEAAIEATDAVKNAKDAIVEQAEKVAESVTGVASVASTEAAAPLASEVLSHVVEPVSGETSTADEANPKHTKSTDNARPDLASAIILEETPIVSGDISEFEKTGPAPVELPVENEELDEPEVASEDELPTATATASIKSAFLGAAAQSVPTRKPILEGYEDIPVAFESMRDDLKSAYSAAMSGANEQYSHALSIVSVQIHGTPQPMHQQMLASVTSAYSNAMASASSRMDVALKMASEQYAGTPTTKNILPTAVSLPTIPSVDWASVESIASQRLQEGRAWAEEQYESAKIAIGLATPTPSTPSEHVSQLLENARYNYYAGLGVAHARYSDFMAAASLALSSVTATPTPTDLAGSASSIASVASESAASAASAVGDNVSSAAAAAYDNAYAAAVAGYDNAASAASAGYDNAASIADKVAEAASAGYDNAASAASAGYENAASIADEIAESASSVASAVGDNVSSAAAAGYENVSAAAAAGYDGAASAAGKVGESWDVVVTKISIQVYGEPTPTPWYASVASVYGAAGDGAASVTSVAGSYASTASDEASKQYAVVSSILSELVVGKEPTFSESVFSRLSAAYVTGASSASSLASAAQASAGSAADLAGDVVKSIGDKVASAASEATEAVKHAKDEL